MKKTLMELGGNAPFIVFDDVSIDNAAAGAMASISAMLEKSECSNRILVQGGIYARFAEKLTIEVKTDVR
ncbi:aldehyde dehydrogenase family protein [Zhongshania sp.]|uniref:aldehyde dehydrogenase family protein n=1 Tax=Zhongshania sp. TaxID=1971902 RepID=UPI002A7F512F|nr:aldehyde dehydrogenase family protein [Zhongshania sp.]